MNKYEKQNKYFCFFIQLIENFEAEPDAFYYAQTIVYGVFQHDYYASFLVSKQYDALCRAFNADNLQDCMLKF